MCLFPLFLVLSAVEAKEVACEKIEGNFWFPPVWAKACNIHQTAFNEPNVAISNDDESIGGLDFDGNKKIEFLPIKVDKSCPNLRGCAARNCSIKEVSKINFNEMNKLQALALK